MFINMNASANLSASTFFSELMRISTDIVWKNQMLANRYEDQDNYTNSEIFMSAYRDILTFDSVYQFDYDVLLSAGLSTEQALAGMDFKESIPLAYRDLCVDKYIDYILNKNSNTGRYTDYIEKNNYYRMLHGLPDNDDTEYFYNTVYDDISKEIPIHEMNISDRYILENREYISALISQNPDKKYLKHLTSKCIDPYIARNAERYSILWMNGSDFSNLIMDFKTVYEDCRMNVIKVYYTEAFKRGSEHYDGFLAMCILFMTVQLMHYKYLDSDLTRDFYDLDSIKYIYNSYSVPFYSDIPLSYHTKIVKNLNKLLSYKGSSRVFVDLFELFNYGTIDIYNYYLIKLHKFGGDNKPLFIKNEDDSYNYSSMYDIKFAKAKLYENIQGQISNPVNHINYNDIIDIDPYWISDSSLLDKLYATNFNYLESKYIGLQVVYDLTKIIYESSFFFKALLDNRTEIANINIYIPTISSSIKLFNVLIYICALICKKYGYEGNISTKLPIVSKILGFNFKEDLSTIRTSIIENEYTKDDNELLLLLINMDINSIHSINSTLDNIDNLQKLFITRKIDAKNKEEYFAYYNLEKTLMTSDFVEDVYKKSNGDTATSFSDLLSDIEYLLYARLNSIDLDIADELDGLFALLTRTFSTLDYFNYSDINAVHVMVTQIFKLLHFFKSAKSELIGYNIVYTISSRVMNMIKFMDNINYRSISVDINEIKDLFEDDVYMSEFISSLTQENMSLYEILSKFHRYLIDEDASYAERVKINLSTNINDNINNLEGVRIRDYPDTVKDKDLDMSDNLLLDLRRYLLDEDCSYTDKIASIIFGLFLLKTKNHEVLIDDEINISVYDFIIKDDSLQTDSLTLIHETLIGD